MRLALAILLFAVTASAEDRWYLSAIFVSDGCTTGKSMCSYKPAALMYSENQAASAVQCSFPSTRNLAGVKKGEPLPPPIPKNAVALCKVTAKDHSALASDPNLTPLPAATDPLSRVATLPDADKSKADAVLTKAGIADKSILSDVTKTNADLLLKVGKALDPAFDPAKVGK